MTKITEEQEELLTALTEQTEALNALRDTVMAEAEARLAEQTKHIEEVRHGLVRQLQGPGSNTPIRRIGTALGIHFYPKIREFIEEALTVATEEPEVVAASGGSATADYSDDRTLLTATLKNWPGLGSGAASFTLFEGEWMADAYEDPFAEAVERALFGDDQDEALRNALAL